MAKAPPIIFSKSRKRARRVRAGDLQAKRGEDFGFIHDAMTDDIVDRLAFLRHEPKSACLEGWSSTLLARQLTPHCHIEFKTLDFDELPQNPPTNFDTIISIASLDRVNDLPGALIQMRGFLKDGGLAMATFVGGQSLPKLRRTMHDAEADRPAARMHPLIDPRSCPQLLSRAGWKDPVVDSYILTVRYSTLDRLVQDLREQALGSVLANAAQPLTRAAYNRAQEAFRAQADADGKVSETFEIITLTGRR